MGFLDGVRVLDLTDERGLLAGRLLADLGADVVLVEPATGTTARSHPPRPAGASGSSYFWEAFAANRRGVRLDLDSPVGQASARALAGAADILLTSLPPSTLTGWGLGYPQLSPAHPGLVYVAISGFGHTGPKAGYADSDLVVWAAGGPLDPHRDQDRPPVRISVPQSYLHAGADAAAGALLAHRHAVATGAGQYVDVSAQASLGVATLGQVLAYPAGDARPQWHQETLRVDQSGSGSGGAAALKKWHCRDGLIEFHLAMGPAAGAFTNNFFGWLHELGACDDRTAGWDWRTIPDQLRAGTFTPEDLQQARAVTAKFLASRTKAEVLREAVARRLLCVGIYDARDITGDPHLRQRGFFAQVGSGDRARVLPARWVHDGAGGAGLRRPAPLPGEHTDEVAADWLPAAPATAPQAAAPQAAVRLAPRGTARTAAASRPTLPLAGLKVLDLSWVVAGPLIGRALADFGATVVRVESARRIETARLMPPFYGGVNDPENSALYGTCNAGKLGVSLDLGTEPGRAVGRDLARWSDVVIESFSRGRLRRWGLDYQSLRREHPGLIMVSTTVMGQSGPYADLAGFGNIGAALSGFQHLAGWPDRLPLGPFGPYTDYLAPRLALVALLAALARRERTGEGCQLDISQVEAGVMFLSPQLAQYAAEGTIAQRNGNRDEAYAPHGVFPCLPDEGRERFVAVAVCHDGQWRRLTELLAAADLAADPQLATAAGRRERADELEERLRAWTGQRRAEEVERLLQAAGIPAHASAASVDYAHDPQLRHRGHLVTLPHSRHGQVVVEGPRYQLSRTPGAPTRAAPAVGQDTEHVLCDLLGYSRQRHARLAADGVLT